MTKGTVLVVGSNATRIELQGGGSAAIGQYLNEMVVPVMALIEAGYSVVLATPDGTQPHIDPASDVAKHFGGDEAAHVRARSFYADDRSMKHVPHAALGDRGRAGWLCRPLRARRARTGSGPHAGCRHGRGPAPLPQGREADCVAVSCPGSDRSGDAAGARVPRRPDLGGWGCGERVRPGLDLCRLPDDRIFL